MNKSLLFLAALCISLSAFCAEEERYFLLLGSYQPFGLRHKAKKDGPFTHTYATYVKVEGEIKDGNFIDPRITDQTTVSWGPCDGVVEVRLFPKRYIKSGCNSSLESALDKGTERGLRKGFWGPFAINQELFEMAKQKVSTLRSYDAWLKNPSTPSSLEYSAVDFTEREKDYSAVSCHHMVADVVKSRKGLLNTGSTYGFSAAAQIVPWYREWISPARGPHGLLTYPWVWQLLEKEILAEKAKRNPGTPVTPYRVEFFYSP